MSQHIERERSTDILAGIEQDKGKGKGKEQGLHVALGVLKLSEAGKQFYVVSEEETHLDWRASRDPNRTPACCTEPCVYRSAPAHRGRQPPTLGGGLLGAATEVLAFLKNRPPRRMRIVGLTGTCGSGREG